MGYKSIIAVTLAVFLTWLVGLMFFIDAIPQSADQKKRGSVTENGGEPIPTDAIIVVTGGDLRLREGIRLLQAGVGKKLLISGVHSRVRDDDVLGFLVTDDICCIEIERKSTNTRQNAIESRDWLRQNAFISLRLVTANYHMPRAHLEFRHALRDEPAPITIVTHPVFPLATNGYWWLGWRGGWLAVSEYNKYLLASLMHALDVHALRAFAAGGNSK